MQHNSNKSHRTFPRALAFALALGLTGSYGTVSYATTADGQSAVTQQAGKRIVRGTVLDENGDPIIGASIKVNGTNEGAVTDINGNFSLNVSPNAELTVSYIGYENTTVAAGQTARIMLKPSDNALNEVVVTALGIKREKKALGYAMQEVKTDGFQDNKSFSVANMLQGKVAGVNISQSGSGLGGSTRIVMRGLSSLSGNNQPLWVVDGFPINDNTVEQADQWGGADYAGAASEINPEDIESISVLKGANAAALYGSRAQNGAIIITTKTGHENQPLRIEYNGTLEVSKAYSDYDYQNTYSQGTGGKYDINSKTSWGEKMTGQTVKNWRNVFYGDDRYGDYTLEAQDDYVTDFFRTGSTYSNSLTATAGGKSVTGRLSYTNTRANSVVPDSWQGRHYFDMNTQFKSKYLDASVKVNYMNEKTRNRPGMGEFGLMMVFVKMPRGIRLRDLENPRGVGAYANNVVNWSGPSEEYSNPYGMTMDANGNKTVRNRIIGQVSATAKFTDYLKLTGRVGIDWYNDNVKSFNQYPDASSSASQYARSMGDTKDFNADLILYFNKTYGDFSVNTNVGASIENQKYDAMNSSAGLFAVPNLVAISNGLSQTTGEGYSQREIQSIFYAGSVGYKNMLYLDFTGRNDWSSTLPEDNRSYFYPSVSLSGIISEMVKLPEWVTFWKVRGSLAKVGHDTDPYRLAMLYHMYTSEDLVNPSIIKEYQDNVKALATLKPESTVSAEVGTEAHFFGNRLNLDFTYYQTRTTDQILSVGVPASSGYSYKTVNAGKINTHGFELMIGGTPIQTKDWQWDINFNWGLSRTSCAYLANGVSRYTLGSTRIASVVVQSGGNFGDIIGKAYKRDAQGRKVIDANGIPESEDDQVVGNMLPKWTGSVANALRYKDFTLSALVDVRVGGDIISNTDNYAAQAGTSARTLEGRDGGIVVDGVNEAGQQNTVSTSAEQYWSSIAGPNGIAEEFIYKGTYVKMRELSLGWNLPRIWFANTPIQSVKFSLVGRDLFYFYKDTPVNPEGAFSRSDYAQAFELGTMPPTRTFGFSLNVKF